jgi:hypothetical protein
MDLNNVNTKTVQARFETAQTGYLMAQQYSVINPQIQFTSTAESRKK